MTPTSGDPDLYAYCETSTAPIGSSTSGGLAVEVFDVRVEDDGGVFGGEDNSFDLLIEVRGFAVPTDYTLTVTGDQAVPTSNCDPA